jgi:CMP-N-acetylneuraminic acid synthetase
MLTCAATNVNVLEVTHQLLKNVTIRSADSWFVKEEREFVVSFIASSNQGLKKYITFERNDLCTSLLYTQCITFLDF